MKKNIFIVGGIVIFLILVFSFIKKQSDIISLKEQKVTVYTAEESYGTDKHAFGGLVGHGDEAVLSAQIGGNISNVYVNEGDQVKKGQTLAYIYAPELSAQYENSDVQLRITQEQEKYARRKWDDLKPEEREKIKLQTEQADAMRKESGAILAKTRIVAPFDGIVSQKFVKIGDTVMPGSQILYLVGNKKQKEVVVDVPVSIGDFISIEDHVKVIDGDNEFDAEVAAVSPTINSSTRKYLVRVVFDDDINVALGSFISVVFDSGNVKGISVPKESIVKQYNDTFVFTVSNNIVSMRSINVLAEIEDKVIVTGINSGDSVVVSGAHNIQDGDHVDVVKN